MNTRIRHRVLGGGAAVAVLTGLGVASAGAPANAASESTWDTIAACESSGNWHINTGNGYSGGLQFSAATWRGFGGSGAAYQASKGEQIRIAEKVLRSQGWGAWPECSAKAGLHGTEGASAAADAPVRVKAKASHRSSRAAHAGHVKLSGATYTVKSGDTLAEIAAKHHVRGGWHRLADANTGTISDPSVIYVGQRLHLPA